jgi:trigger factor
MVTTTVEKLTPTRVKLNISITPDELKPSIEHAYEHIGSQVNIPGFRKGKIPPQLIDQRVGREEVLNHAVNDGLNAFFQEALTAEKIRALGRPEANVVQLPDVKDFSGELRVTVEVDVRPEFALPKYEGLRLIVDTVAVSADDVKDELDILRSRFGTLVTVDRPAKTGDFVTLDLVAKIGDTEVDTADSISYEVGSGELIEGIDEALDALSAGETTTFESTLLGGDHEGEVALISVTLTAVKERELPEADDEFAQISSQFDTISELKADIKDQLAKSKAFGQGAQARDQIVDKLLELVDIPIPPALVEDEVHRHLENENRLDDMVHRAEVVESSTKTFRSQILLDAIGEKEEVRVSQDELTQYLVQGAAQYDMEPGEFIEVLNKNNQIPGMIAEVARSKALAVVLGKAKVVDGKNKPVDVSAFASSPSTDAAAEFVAAGADEHAGHDH